MSIDIKLSKAHISKIIQSDASFRSWLVNLVKKALTIVAISLARDDLSGLVSSLTSNVINKFDRKMSGKEFEWYYENFEIISRFGCINWWSY